VLYLVALAGATPDSSADLCVDGPTPPLDQVIDHVEMLITAPPGDLRGS
jgi:hypothetical protein